MAAAPGCRLRAVTGPARLRLPPETLGSMLEEMVENQAGEIDYQLKSNAQRVDGLRRLIGEIKAGIRKVRSSVIE